MKEIENFFVVFYFYLKGYSFFWLNILIIERNPFFFFFFYTVL